jgi:CRP-like cAMP-binding protein
MAKPANEPFDPLDFLANAGTGRTIRDFRKNQKVYAQGDIADAVFYVQKGKLKLTVSSHGKEAVVAIVAPSQFFGEGCLNGHRRRTATMRAMEDSTLTEISKDTMIVLLHQEPKFSELFTAHLLDKNLRIEEDLIDQLFNSGERRLARLLLRLANFGAKGSLRPIDPNISQETLAEMIGTTRSRVSFFMNKFRKLGFVSYNRKIEVHDSLASVVLPDVPQIERCRR